MKTYLVRRPYCNPPQVVVIAHNKKKAITMVHKQYGYCSDTKASIKTKEGIVLDRPSQVSFRMFYD